MPERLQSEVLYKVRYINTLTFYLYLPFNIHFRYCSKEVPVPEKTFNGHFHAYGAI